MPIGFAMKLIGVIGFIVNSLRRTTRR